MKTIYAAVALAAASMMLGSAPVEAAKQKTVILPQTAPIPTPRPHKLKPSRKLIYRGSAPHSVIFHPKPDKK